ncbi:MAG: AzlD domain-containing protein [Thermoleophilia bacterium]
MTWGAILLLAGLTYAMKAAGPVVLGDRALPPLATRALALVPPALLASLVAVGTFASGRALVADARLVGFAVAVIAAWRRAPFLVVVLAAAAATALTRLA